MLVELLVEGAQDGHGGTGGLGGGRLVPAGTVPDLLEPEDPFHDALGGPALLGRGPFTAQNLQHQLEVHLERGPGGPGGGSGGFLALLQQVQRHKRPTSLLLLGPGQQVLGEGLGQGAEGGEGQPLPGEHAHIRFCHSDGIHQQHPLWISSMRLTAMLAWLLLSWGPTYFTRWAPTTLQARLGLPKLSMRTMVPARGMDMP